MERRVPLALIVALTALLSAALTLAVDRGITALQPPATPLPRPVATVIVRLDAPSAAPQPSLAPADETQRQLRQMEQDHAQQQGETFVLKAVQQLSFALDALATNNGERANGQLVAAQTSLTQATTLVGEALKPQLDAERFELGRIRGALVVDPRNLDEDLRAMRDRLLDLIGAPPAT